VGQSEGPRGVAPGSKIVIDATMKGTYPQISLPPKKYMMQALANWDATGLPPIRMTDRTRLLLERHGEGLSYNPFES
jgi:hypothetical protein